MNTQAHLRQLQEHLASCELCREVVSQMHTKCDMHHASTSFVLEAIEREQVKAAGALLCRAVALLEAGDKAHPDMRNLQWVVERARRAARHVLVFGALTDSDLALAGMPPAKQRRRRT